MSYFPMRVGSGTAGLLKLTSGTSSSRGPAEGSAAQEVQVDVVDAVAGVVAAVHHEAEAALAEAQLAGDVARLPHHRPDQAVVARPEGQEARPVAAGNDEDAGRGLGAGG